MEAIYTTTGMMIRPFKPSKAGMILRARSVWMPAAHKPVPITAYTMKDGDESTTKCLVTYRCHKEWLKQTIPDIVITDMPKNHVDKIETAMALNADVMPNDIQFAATQAVLDNNFKTCFFNIPTGVGKTLLAVYLMSILKVKSWIMCYRTIVLDQWVKTMREKTTMDMDRVKIINSSKDLLKMASGEFPFDDYDVYLSTPMILTKFAEKHGLDLLNEVYNNCGIGVKFFDEAHYNIGNITKINGLTNIERTYYLSADFGPCEPTRQKLYLKMFANVPVIRPREELAKSMQFTNAIVVRYNTHPSLNSIEGTFTKFGFNHNKYMEYQLTQDAFYHAFTSVLDTIQKTNSDRKYKTLFLCTLIDHVDYFKEWLENYYRENVPEDQRPKVVRYHSQMPEDERDDALENGQVIVSTYQSMGVGVDLQMIRYVVALSPVNSIEDNQAAGRARALPDGEDCFYFMFVDDGFSYVKEKLPYRLSYLEKQKVKKIYSIKYS